MTSAERQAVMATQNAGERASIEIVHGVRPDVISGLELYRHNTNAAVDDLTLRTDWTRWIEGGSHGQGICGIAKAGGKVIGFYALLPTQMLIAGHEIRGAKGEFHVVAPDYRRTVSEKGVPISFALVADVKKAAHEAGIAVTFGRTTKSAFITRATGARPFSFTLNDHLTVFRRDALRNKIATHKQIAALVATTALRGVYAARRKRAPDSVTEVQEFTPAHLPAPGVANRLVHPSAVMLNFRFPAKRYIKFVAEDASGRPAYLVFSRPRPKQTAMLMDWSTLNLTAPVFSEVLSRMYSYCSAERASLLRVPISHDWQSGFAMQQAGFVHVQRESTVYITCNQPDLKDAVDGGPWEFTNAHMGYYDSGNDDSERQ